VSTGSDSGRFAASLLLTGAAVALAVLTLGAACTGDEASSAPETSTNGSTEPVATTDAPTEPVPTVEGLPDSVAETRAAILAAANAQDYDALEPMVDADLFLSDAGFGVDPVAHWRKQGTAPLEAMAVLLDLPHTIRETNEGTLYQWPRFTADSDPDEMSAAERDALETLLGEEGLRASFLDETGYVAPRLGILADGTWWFFVLEPTP
jgi:hypothetical protein